MDEEASGKKRLRGEEEAKSVRLGHQASREKVEREKASLGRVL